MGYPRNNFHRRTRRYEKPRFVTRAEEERRNAIADEDYRRRKQAEDKRIMDALRAQWEALTPEQRAESEANSKRARARSHAEYLEHEAWKTRKAAERADPNYVSTFGT